MVKMNNYILYLRIKACKANNGKYHSTEKTKVKFSCKQLKEIDLSVNQSKPRMLILSCNDALNICQSE